MSSPIRHEHRREQAPDVQEHADPARHDAHPHRHFGAADVHVLVVVRVRVLLDDIPVFGFESVQRPRARMPEEERTLDVPVGQEHRDVHRADRENDVEPCVLGVRLKVLAGDDRRRAERDTYVIAGTGALVVPGLPRHVVFVLVLPILIERGRGNSTRRRLS